jgi:hypothetical protein
MTSAGSLPINVCVTGHSLGGSLATALALYLRDNQQEWDPSSKATVTTINFAAPTAGDSAFATHFDSQFAYTGACPLPTWADPNIAITSTSFADCVRNQYDVAPLVWNGGDMGKIEGLYSSDPFIIPHIGTSEIISAIQSATANCGYTQVQAGQPVLPGQLIGVGQLPSGVNHWIAEAEEQHGLYAQLLQVSGLPVTSGPPVRAAQASTAGS